MGHISIRENTLTVEVNSIVRATLFKEEIAKRLSSGVKYKTTLLEPIESKLRKKFSQQKNEKQKSAEEDQSLEQHPEIKKRIAEMNQQHWDHWVHMKVPALGNKTPKQAARSKDGREMLGALLTQFEREAAERPQPGVTIDTFKNIRKFLGI